MHEQRLVNALADAVARAAGDEVSRVTEIQLRIGELAPVDPAGVSNGLGDVVRDRWGAAPRIVVDMADGAVSDDVRLVGVTVGG